MSSSSDVAAESFDSSRVARSATHLTQPFFWSVRRELWENRSIYIAPPAVAAVALLGFLISTLTGRFALATTHKQQALTLPYDFAAGVIMLTTMAVGVFYSIETLYGERRDRSVLFWKSLPVSDLTTVLSKAIVPIFILQFIGFAVTVALQFVMLTLSSAMLLGRGQSPATLWSEIAFFEMSLMLLYHLFTIHMLWHAPIYSWLLMVSAWSRRVPFLWAVLPPLAIIAIEKLAFNTSHFAHLLGYRFMGGAESMTMGDDMPIHPGTHLTPARFLGTPGLWIGLVVAAAFLLAAVRLRRYRGPI